MCRKLEMLVLYCYKKTGVTIKENDQDKYRTTYAYFKNGYLKEVKGQQWDSQASQWDDKVLVGYEYDKTGGCTKRINNGGSDITTNYTYNDRGELTNISHDKSGTLYALSYLRDLGGNPIEIDYSGSSCPSVVRDKIVYYTYDSISRLMSEKIGNGTPISWVYDWVGNRSQTGTYSYNQVDQLISGQAYQYDMRGNLSLDPQGRTFSYDSTNLLTGVVDGANTVDMTWDADDNRVRLEAGSSTWQFIYDSTAGIPAVLVAKTGQNETYIVRGPSGELLADVTGGAVGYYHFNELGSTMLVTNGSGAVTDSLAYDAWGDILAGTTKPYNYVGSLGYYSHNSGQVIDDLLQLGVRFYDPQVGRFTQRDPIESSINDFMYVDGSPIEYTDPDGEKRRYKERKKPIHGRQPKKRQKPESPKVKPQPSNGVKGKITGGFAKLGIVWAVACGSAVSYHINDWCKGEWNRDCVCDAIDALQSGLDDMWDDSSAWIKPGICIGNWCASNAYDVVNGILNCEGRKK